MRKKPNPMENLINQGNYGILSARLSLTKIIRQLSWDVVRGKMSDFQTRMNIWIDRTYPHVGAKKKSSIRGNVSRALASERVTWGTYMKGLDILGFSSAYLRMVFLKKDNKTEAVYTANTLYKALISGDHYNKGDVLIYAVCCTFASNDVVYETWYNKTQCAFIEVESLTGLKELNSTIEIGTLISDVSMEYAKTDDLDNED